MIKFVCLLFTLHPNCFIHSLAALKTSHWVSRCQNCLTKIPLKFFLPLINWASSKFNFCPNLISLFVFVAIRVLSHFEFLSLNTTWVLSQFEFCHNLSFVTTSLWVVSHFEFCHYLSFWDPHHLSFFCLNHNFKFWVSS